MRIVTRDADRRDRTVRIQTLKSSFTLFCDESRIRTIRLRHNRFQPLVLKFGRRPALLIDGIEADPANTPSALDQFRPLTFQSRKGWPLLLSIKRGDDRATRTDFQAHPFDGEAQIGSASATPYSDTTKTSRPRH